MNKIVASLLISVVISTIMGAVSVCGESDGFKAFMSEPFRFASAWSPCFEANAGRYDRSIRYLSRGPDYWLALESQRAVFAIADTRKGSNSTPTVIEMQFIDSSPYPGIAAEEPLPRKIRYYVGSEKRELIESPAYSKVHYRSLFPGIDLYFIVTRATLEYYFVLSSRADLHDVVIELKGVERLALSERGDLIIRTASGTAVRPAPRFFQEIAGVRREIKGSYVLLSGNRIGFDAPVITEMASLIVDPILIYFDAPKNWHEVETSKISFNDLMP